MPLPLSFYNNLVHLLYIFFFSRKLFFFWCSLFFGYCASWIEPDYLNTWSGEFSVSTFTLVPNETSAHLTVSWNVVIRFGDVLRYSGYISSDFLSKQLQCCPGSGVSSFSPFAAGAPPSVSAPVSERHRAAAVNELFAHTQYRLVVCYPHRGCVLCTVKEKSNKDMLSLTFSCWNHGTADRWTYFYLDWFQTILWIGLPFGDNKQSYYCT